MAKASIQPQAAFYLFHLRPQSMMSKKQQGCMQICLTSLSRPTRDVCKHASNPSAYATSGFAANRPHNPQPQPVPVSKTRPSFRTFPQRKLFLGPVPAPMLCTFFKRSCSVHVLPCGLFFVSRRSNVREPRPSAYRLRRLFEFL